MAFRLGPSHQHHATTLKVADPNVVIAVDIQAPRYIDRPATGEPSRRRLGAVGTNHADQPGRFRVFQSGSTHDPKLLHDGRAVGNPWYWKVQGRIARHPDIALRVQCESTDADPSPKRFHLGGIVGPEPDYRVRLRVADPDAILGVDDDVEGRLQSCDLDDSSVLHPSAGEVQQLIVRAIGDPDVTVCGDADAHQAKEFLFEREVALFTDRMTIEIHHEHLPV